MAGMFNSFLAGRPLVASRCYKRAFSSARTRGYLFRPIPSIQTRHIFSFPTIRRVAETDGGKRSQDLDDGSRPMIELVHALHQRSRPPSQFALASGFMTFIDKRLDQGMVTKSQAEFLLHTFQHLLLTPYPKSTGTVRAFLELENFEFTLGTLARAKLYPDAIPLVQDLARSIFHRISIRLDNAPELGEQRVLESLQSCVAVLSSTGAATEALQLMLGWRSIVSSSGALLPWVNIMKGFAREGRQSKIPGIIQQMENWGITLDRGSQEEILLLLAEENCISALEVVYGLPIQPTTTASVCVLKAALWNSKPQWAAQIATALPAYPTPETRDALLLLSIARGDSIDSIHQQLDDMASKNPEIRSTMTIDTLNTLIEYAIMVNRTDLGEQGTQIAQAWGLTPDSQTYLLPLRSQIESGDINEAVALFQKLDTELEIDKSDILILNKLIKQLCLAEYSLIDFDTVNSLVDRLLEADGHFEPDTLGILCKSLLYCGDLEGVSTLLRPIIDRYGPEELSKIRKGFIQYIRDMDQPTDSAWEVYELLNLAFQTTSVAARTRIMNAFFKRQRSDLACLVFGHMRQKGQVDSRPSAHTYAQCFKGIAEAADADGLHLVHNMLKLDLEVTPKTKVLNGLMLAYASCGMADKSMAFFRDILHSVEGPSEQTLVVFFRACESYHSGIVEANKMMEKVRSLDILITESVYNAYVGALGGHCELELAAEAIKTMESKIGLAPTTLTLGNLYNALPTQFWKDQAEEWAKATYPELWVELEKSGRTEDEDGLQHLNIDRSIQI
ncbi:complex I intermediate-associated protein [Arthroderma uncinatum]|uniref:complex I intermediate-associated protein n=1 Tax=Arthroderma uncinatum TaxID=74035 RepID=UPI00144A9D74|nr:complex I intermediate-associated protein [Arthroderma uncinatum]KAF3484255.1 complex I intermediate-associated protein [Arthroderma uncinatum]